MRSIGERIHIPEELIAAFEFGGKSRLRAAGLALDRLEKNVYTGCGWKEGYQFADYDVAQEAIPKDDVSIDFKLYSSNSITIHAGEHIFGLKHPAHFLHVYKLVDSNTCVFEGSVLYSVLVKKKLLEDSQFEAGGKYARPSDLVGLLEE